VNTVENPTIVLAGSVGTSRRTLERLIAHRARVVGVLGLAESAAARVSGYSRLDDLAAEAGIAYRDFTRLNDPGIVDQVRAWAPDLLFVVGLSQLVGAELLAVPRLAGVGFHPTRLPAGRGRAPIAWILLDGVSAAATFFVLEEDADAGAILVQEPFDVNPGDHAAEVVEAMELALGRALDRWLPELLAGRWDPVAQDPAAATVYGRRTPADGRIDWHRPAAEIAALIRASSRPHPGAYTWCPSGLVSGAELPARLRVWRCQPEEELPFRGAVGRILAVDEHRGALVQTGSGLLWLTETELAGAPPTLRVGMRLGLVPEDEIVALSRRLGDLEARLREMTEQVTEEVMNKVGRRREEA